MSCFQLSVSGGGNANPPTVALPGAYSASDPGILINIYYRKSRHWLEVDNVVDDPC